MPLVSDLMNKVIEKYIENGQVEFSVTDDEGKPEPSFNLQNKEDEQKLRSEMENQILDSGLKFFSDHSSEEIIETPIEDPNTTPESTPKPPTGPFFSEITKGIPLSLDKFLSNEIDKTELQNLETEAKNDPFDESS